MVDGSDASWQDIVIIRGCRPESPSERISCSLSWPPVRPLGLVTGLG